MPVELLFVPVGTQPYAPTLAIVGNPCRTVALLETKDTHVHGLEVEAASAGREAAPSVFLHVHISETDVKDIGLKMKAVYDSQGLPSGAAVGADITGGRKTMSAAVAGVGSLFGWRMFYVEGKFEPHLRGLSHHEQVVELANILDVFGARRRETALALLAGGAPAAAARELLALVEESAASAEDRAWLELTAAAQALRGGDMETFARLGASAARAVGKPLRPAARALLDAAARSGAAGKQARAALFLLAARVHARDGAAWIAEAMVAEALRLAARRKPRAAAPPSVTLTECFAEPPFAPWRRAVDELDAVFSGGLDSIVARPR